MKKTFYTVRYSMWGADGPSIAWFDSKTGADTFYAAGDYRDKPVSRTVSNPTIIAEYQARVELEKIGFDI